MSKPKKSETLTNIPRALKDSLQAKIDVKNLRNPTIGFQEQGRGQSPVNTFAGVEPIPGHFWSKWTEIILSCFCCKGLQIYF